MNTTRVFAELRCAITLAFAFAVIPFLVLASNTPAIVGNWNGILDGGELGKLHVVVHITQAKNGSLTGAVDSADQGAKGIPISSVTYEDSAVHFVCRTVGGFHDGNMKGGNSQIDGAWQQGTRDAAAPSLSRQVKASLCAELKLWSWVSLSFLDRDTRSQNSN